MGTWNPKNKSRMTNHHKKLLGLKNNLKILKQTWNCIERRIIMKASHNWEGCWSNLTCSLQTGLKALLLTRCRSRVKCLETRSSCRNRKKWDSTPVYNHNSNFPKAKPFNKLDRNLRFHKTWTSIFWKRLPMLVKMHETAQTRVAGKMN